MIRVFVGFMLGVYAEQRYQLPRVEVLWKDLLNELKKYEKRSK